MLNNQVPPMTSKTKPKFELILGDNRHPDSIGVAMVGQNARAWVTEDYVIRHIEEIKNDLAFYQEILNLFKEK